jgi:hypothetical protein
MAILVLNGHTIPVLDGSPSWTYEEIGPVGASIKGWTRDAVRTRRRVFTATVPYHNADKRDEIIHLVSGRGHHIPFDTSLYSDGGVGPNSGYSCTLGTTAPTPKYGTRRVNVGSGTALSYVVEAPLGDVYSVLWWYNLSNTTPGANTYLHHAVTKNAAGTVVYYENAVAGATINNYSVAYATPSLTVSLEGQEAPGGGATAGAFFDDLVILPFDISATMVASIYGAGRAFSAMPLLNLTGDILREPGPVLVRGKVGGDVRLAQASVNGTWYNNLRTFPITLTEAQPAGR